MPLTGQIYTYKTQNRSHLALQCLRATSIKSTVKEGVDWLLPLKNLLRVNPRTIFGFSKGK